VWRQCCCCMGTCCPTLVTRSNRFRRRKVAATDLFKIVVHLDNDMETIGNEVISLVSVVCTIELSEVAIFYWG